MPIIHSGTIDDGVQFQIVPNTRKVTVPSSHRVIGTIGDHGSEEITFQCPKAIDGHDVVNCSDHYISWMNAGGDEGQFNCDEITVDDKNMYFKWVIESIVTNAAGKVKFAVHFEDKDENGNLLYRWSTTENNECEVLGTVKTKSTPPVVPEGYLKPTGTLGITENGTHNVAEHEYVDVAVQPKFDTLDIDSNGVHDVAEYKNVNVAIESGMALSGIIDGTITELKEKDLAVTSIADHAFYKRTKLEKVSLPDSVTKIGDSAFYGCVSLKSITFPNSVEEIGLSAFASCTALTDATFAEGSKCTRIGDNAFSATGIETFTIPASVETLGNAAFIACANLTAVHFADGCKVTVITANMCSNCSKLAGVTFGEGVKITTIDSAAFSNCVVLPYIAIPSTVTTINDSAFSGCKALKVIDFSNHTSVPTLGNQALNKTPTDLQIKVPAALYDEWKAAIGWSSYASKIVAV